MKITLSCAWVRLLICSPSSIIRPSASSLDSDVPIWQKLVGSWLISWIKPWRLKRARLASAVDLATALLLPEIHGYQKRTLAFFVLDIVLLGCAVMQRVAANTGLIFLILHNSCALSSPLSDQYVCLQGH